MQRIIGTGVTLLLVMWIGTAALAQGAPAAGAGAAILPGQAIGTFHLGQDVTQVVTTKSANPFRGRYPRQQSHGLLLAPQAHRRDRRQNDE